MLRMVQVDLESRIKEVEGTGFDEHGNWSSVWFRFFGGEESEGLLLIRSWRI